MMLFMLGRECQTESWTSIKANQDDSRVLCDMLEFVGSDPARMGGYLATGRNQNIRLSSAEEGLQVRVSKPAVDGMKFD